MGDYAEDALRQFWKRPFREAKQSRRSKSEREKAMVCRICNVGNLRWGNVKGGQWCLFTKEGDLHVCYKKNEECG